MKRIARLAILVLPAASVLLSGCAPLIIAGGATAAGVYHDRRTAGSVISDETIELKAARALYLDKDIHDQAHVSATSYNQIVLLTGEAPTPELRTQAENLVRGISGVRLVHDEISIGAPTTLAVRGEDAWITTKVKTGLFRIKLPGFDPTRVKVVTENANVYLMGLLRRDEAEAVVNRVRTVDGVRRVVKVFEYID